MKVGKREIEISHPDKVLFPDVGVTKRDLAGYYARIADTILPHIGGRAISMERFPDGITGEGFYQKEAPDYFPDWFQKVSVTLKGEGGTQHQLVCSQPADLVYLAE